MKLPKILLVLTSLTFISANYAQEFRGSVEPIPEKIAANMIGKTWHSGCPLPLKSLSYVTVSYWGFDHQVHEGHFVVLKNLAGESMQIFQALFDMKFPIEKMQLPDVYATSPKDNWSSVDWKSSEDNNTNGFFCREDDQNPGQFSPHTYGIAFDINPVQNPSYIANKQIMPKAGKKYFNRQLQPPGMVNEKVVALFAKYGWKWGGYFTPGNLDYQHFQKDMDFHYICPTLIIFRR